MFSLIYKNLWDCQSEQNMYWNTRYELPEFVFSEHSLVSFSYYLFFFINSKFEGQKILATTNNKWVGIDDHPMIADNRELEKMFEKKDQVNFVVLEDRTPQPRHGGRTAMLGKLHLVYQLNSVTQMYMYMFYFLYLKTLLN